MRDKFIKFLENYGLWFFCVWVILMMLMLGLSGCGKEMEERAKKEDSAIKLKSKIYNTPFNDDYIEVVEIEGCKVIMWRNGRGSDMELIALDDVKAFEQLSKDYEELWDENQKLFGVLAEIENEPGGHEMLKKLWNENTK